MTNIDIFMSNLNGLEAKKVGIWKTDAHLLSSKKFKATFLV